MLKLITSVTDELKEPEPVIRIWQCNCGCQEFNIYEDQSVQCSKCETYSNNIRCFYDEDFSGPSKGPLDK
jgi:hypothetical protein